MQKEKDHIAQEALRQEIMPCAGLALGDFHLIDGVDAAYRNEL